MTIDPRHILIGILNENDLSHIESFDCGDENMNYFLRYDCFEEQKKGLNITYLLFYRGELAAFCSICADKINLAKDEQSGHELPRGSVPAVKVARIGRAQQYRDLGLGKLLFDYVRMEIIELAQRNLGIRFITLDAYEHRVPYYSSLRFMKNNNQGRNCSTISMRLDIYGELLMNEHNKPA